MQLHSLGLGNQSCLWNLLNIMYLLKEVSLGIIKDCVKMKLKIVRDQLDTESL